MNAGNVFYELNQRLSDLENPLVTPELFSVADYYLIIRDIEWTVDLCDPADVSDKARFHLARIQKLVEKIGSSLSDETRKIKRPLELQVIEEGFQLTQVPRELFLLDELDYYKQRLGFIISNRIGYGNKEQKTIQNEISLPENFTLKELQKNFSPLLSIPQTILFLHYLREVKFTPNYNNSSLGTIAEIVFGRNKKAIKDGLGAAHELTSDKKELNAFREIIASIIKEIDEDYKRAC